MIWKRARTSRSFSGIIGFIDPARKDVPDVIKTYHKAGIRVVMVTGDHPETAKKIASDVGIFNKSDESKVAVNRKDLRFDSQDKEASQLLNTPVFERVTPHQKLDLVKFYQKNNHVVGMTGKLWSMTAIYGITMTAAVIGISYFGKVQLRLQPEVINNLGFYTLVFVQILNVFNTPLRNRSFFRNQVTGNPWVWLAILICTLIMIAAYFLPFMQKALSLVPLGWDQFKWVLIFGFFTLGLTQLLKRLIFRTQGE